MGEIILNRHVSNGYYYYFFLLLLKIPSSPFNYFRLQIVYFLVWKSIDFWYKVVNWKFIFIRIFLIEWPNHPLVEYLWERVLSSWWANFCELSQGMGFRVFKSLYTSGFSYSLVKSSSWFIKLFNFIVTRELVTKICFKDNFIFCH